MSALASPLLAGRSGYWAGAFQDTATGDTFDVVDPASGAVLATLPALGAEQARAAVESAERALRTPLELAERARILTAIADGLATHRDVLAELITLENGKPVAESLGEVDYAAGFFRESLRHLDALRPHTLERRPRGLGWTVHHRPAGVGALITPWNFPVGMLAKKLAGAIAAGCPTVVKPSELTPLCCIALFGLLDGLDLPPGLVNLVFGDAPAIGQVLCEHPAVRVLSFTGSTRVGKLLAAQAAPYVKRLSLELGGNAPFLVFDDADLDQAVDALMANKFRCAGQTCVCSNRVYVQRGVAEPFIAAVSDRVRALRVGSGSTPGVEIGPLINQAGRDKVQRHVRDAVAQGAELRVGGATDPSAAGTFFPPTVLVGVTPAMLCTQEETFGPVVAITVFDDEDTVVSAADATDYGLAAYVFTTDLDRAHRVIGRLHFGHVGLNTATGPTPEAPFGGFRQSGLGREGGLEGILEFVELQTVPSPPGGHGDT